MTNEALNDLRREAADEAYLAYDYSYEIVDASGWEFWTGGPDDEWTRTVFYADPEDSSRPSIKGTFRVTFAAGSATTKDVQAYDPNGPVGNPVTAPVAP